MHSNGIPRAPPSPPRHTPHPAGNYEAAVETCFKANRLADALLIANIFNRWERGGGEEDLLEGAAVLGRQLVAPDAAP